VVAVALAVMVGLQVGMALMGQDIHPALLLALGLAAMDLAAVRVVRGTTPRWMDGEIR
jgi:hypothetical protein